uniref:Protein Ycf2 n=1 Tax=Gnetum parvifolium TaxID=33153 RepID=A0A1B2IKA6_GNEPA|nr:hypothetical protein [Gnetum parvifolium]ANZ53724.1 hypothetical protein [Gnetum parvifolium]ANZ53790.1 hypothetical protein [Gnetum parvifolium]
MRQEQKSRLGTSEESSLGKCPRESGIKQLVSRLFTWRLNFFKKKKEYIESSLFDPRALTWWLNFFKQIQSASFDPWTESILLRFCTQILSHRERLIKLFDFRIIGALLLRDLRSCSSKKVQIVVLLTLPVFIYNLKKKNLIERNNFYSINLFPTIYSSTHFRNETSEANFTRNLWICSHLFLFPKSSQLERFSNRSIDHSDPLSANSGYDTCPRNYPISWPKEVLKEDKRYIKENSFPKETKRFIENWTKSIRYSVFDILSIDECMTFRTTPVENFQCWKRQPNVFQFFRGLERKRRVDFCKIKTDFPNLSSKLAISSDPECTMIRHNQRDINQFLCSRFLNSSPWNLFCSSFCKELLFGFCRLKPIVLKRTDRFTLSLTNPSQVSANTSAFDIYYSKLFDELQKQKLWNQIFHHRKKRKNPWLNMTEKEDDSFDRIINQIVSILPYGPLENTIRNRVWIFRTKNTMNRPSLNWRKGQKEWLDCLIIRISKYINCNLHVYKSSDQFEYLQNYSNHLVYFDPKELSIEEILIQITLILLDAPEETELKNLWNNIDISSDISPFVEKLISDLNIFLSQCGPETEIVYQWWFREFLIRIVKPTIQWLDNKPKVSKIDEGTIAQFVWNEIPNHTQIIYFFDNENNRMELSDNTDFSTIYNDRDNWLNSVKLSNQSSSRAAFDKANTLQFFDYLHHPRFKSNYKNRLPSYIEERIPSKNNLTYAQLFRFLPIHNNLFSLSLGEIRPVHSEKEAISLIESQVSNISGDKKYVFIIYDYNLSKLLTRWNPFVRDKRDISSVEEISTMPLTRFQIVNLENFHRSFFEENNPEQYLKNVSSTLNLIQAQSYQDDLLSEICPNKNPKMLHRIPDVFDKFSSTESVQNIKENEAINKLWNLWKEKRQIFSFHSPHFFQELAKKQEMYRINTHFSKWILLQTYMPWFFTSVWWKYFGDTLFETFPDILLYSCDRVVSIWQDIRYKLIILRVLSHELWFILQSKFQWIWRRIRLSLRFRVLLLNELVPWLVSFGEFVFDELRTKSSIWKLLRLARRDGDFWIVILWFVLMFFLFPYFFVVFLHWISLLIQFNFLEFGLHSDPALLRQWWVEIKRYSEYPKDFLEIPDWAEPIDLVILDLVKPILERTTSTGPRLAAIDTSNSCEYPEDFWEIPDWAKQIFGFTSDDDSVFAKSKKYDFCYFTNLAKKDEPSWTQLDAHKYEEELTFRFAFRILKKIVCFLLNPREWFWLLRLRMTYFVILISHKKNPRAFDRSVTMSDFIIKKQNSSLNSPYFSSSRSSSKDDKKSNSNSDDKKSISNSDDKKSNLNSDDNNNNNEKKKETFDLLLLLRTEKELSRIESKLTYRHFVSEGYQTTEEPGLMYLRYLVDIFQKDLVNYRFNPFRLAEKWVFFAFYQRIAKSNQKINSKARKTPFFLGPSLSKGILLIGPEETDRSYLVQSLAADSYVPLIKINLEWFFASCQTFSQIHRTLIMAEIMSPCVIWIPSIHELERNNRTSTIKREIFIKKKALLHRLLDHMDSCDENIFISRRNIVFIASTHIPRKVDPNLMTPNRFGQFINIRVLLIPQREKEFPILLRRKGFDLKKELFYLDDFGSRTVGYTARDLARLVNEAVGISCLRAKSVIDTNTIRLSLYRQTWGLQSIDQGIVSVLKHHERLPYKVGKAILQTTLRTKSSPVSMAKDLWKTNLSYLSKWYLEPSIAETTIKEFTILPHILGCLAGSAARDSWLMISEPNQENWTPLDRLVEHDFHLASSLLESLLAEFPWLGICRGKSDNNKIPLFPPQRKTRNHQYTMRTGFLSLVTEICLNAQLQKNEEFDESLVSFPRVWRLSFLRSNRFDPIQTLNELGLSEQVRLFQERRILVKKVENHLRMLQHKSKRFNFQKKGVMSQYRKYWEVLKKLRLDLENLSLQEYLGPFRSQPGYPMQYSRSYNKPVLFRGRRFVWDSFLIHEEDPDFLFSDQELFSNEETVQRLYTSGAYARLIRIDQTKKAPLFHSKRIFRRFTLMTNQNFSFSCSEEEEEKESEEEEKTKRIKRKRKRNKRDVLVSQREEPHIEALQRIQGKGMKSQFLHVHMDSPLALYHRWVIENPRGQSDRWDLVIDRQRSLETNCSVSNELFLYNILSESYQYLLNLFLSNRMLLNQMTKTLLKTKWLFANEIKHLFSTTGFQISSLERLDRSGT